MLCAMVPLTDELVRAGAPTCLLCIGLSETTTTTTTGAGAGAGAGEVSILLIDAWRYDGGWTWNQWHKIGSCDVTICDLKPRALLAWLRSEGYLGEGSKGRVAIEDDQYNVVIVDKSTRPIGAGRSDLAVCWSLASSNSKYIRCWHTGGFHARTPLLFLRQCPGYWRALAARMVLRVGCTGRGAQRDPITRRARWDCWRKGIVAW